jgi:O-succinylbenzoic acid--CoA ligase
MQAVRRVLVAEAEPRKFMTAFAQAVAGDAEIFLGDPKWTLAERRQLDALLPPATSTAPFAGGTRAPQGAADTDGAAGPGGWLMIPTGGTSGQLRFARHDAATMAAAVRGFARHFGLAQVNAVGLLPLHHVSGLMAWMRCVLTGGEYRPLDWKTIEGGALPVLPVKVHGWVVSLVPTQLERLVNQPTAVEWLRKFRVIFIGGGPPWPELLNRAAGLRLPLSLSYGMTESAAMVAALRPAEFLAGDRSSGPVLPHAAVEIDADGVIAIKGDSVFRGYYPQWRPAGAFATTDAGYFDRQKRLHVTGRRDQIIISGGEKIDPQEVEAVLRGSGEMPEVVVLGVPDAEWGQVVVATYPASSAPKLKKVAEIMGRLLAPAKRPKLFVPLKHWPVNDGGKVNRAAAAHLAEQALQAGLGDPGA